MPPVTTFPLFNQEDDLYLTLPKGSECTKITIKNIIHRYCIVKADIAGKKIKYVVSGHSAEKFRRHLCYEMVKLV